MSCGLVLHELTQLCLFRCRRYRQDIEEFKQCIEECRKCRENCEDKADCGQCMNECVKSIFKKK